MPFQSSYEKCIMDFLEGKVYGYLHTKLLKKSLLEHNDCKFVDGIDFMEDLLLCIKLFYYARKLSYVDKPLYHYNRCNISSMTAIINEVKIKQIIQVEEGIEKFLINKGIFDFYSGSVKKHRALSKVSILKNCKKIKPEYMKLYSNEKLSLIKNISLMDRFILRLCDLKMFVFVKVIISFRNILKTLVNFVRL